MFGSVLRARRRRAGLTQEALAERSGLGVRTIRKLENGLIRQPRNDTVRLLADGLNLTGEDRAVFIDSALAENDADVSARRPSPVFSLPSDTADFTGMDEQIAVMEARLAERQAADTAVPVVALAGAAGMGKTTVAVHVAHRLRRIYPDGGMFINLRGTQSNPVPPDEALGRLLHALNESAAASARSLDEKVERYRLTLAARRVLVVLDDAGGLEQVAPLLPGHPGCGVIITSRAPVAGLPGVITLDVQAMSESHALGLLRHIIGDTRLDQDPGAAETLVRLCDQVPLAVRIAGARLANRPQWPVATLVSRMGDERRRLDELRLGEFGVRSSLAVSYHGLDETGKRAFRLLGFLDPSDFAASTAAALLAVPVAAAEDVLDRLADARLVEYISKTGGRIRYRMHDLVRIYARECAEAEESVGDRTTAVARAITQALRAVEGVAEHLPVAVRRLYQPDLDPSWLAVDGGYGPELLDEEPMLVAMVERASALGLDRLACALAEALVFAVFGTYNRFDGWDRTHAAACAAADAAGNDSGRAALECGLGQLRYTEDRFAEAKHHFQLAIDRFRAGGNPHGEAVATNGIGTAHRELGEHDLALLYHERAREALFALGDWHGVAHALYGIGYAHRELGHDELAAHHLEEAARQYRRIGHHRGEAIAIRGIGLIHRARDEHELAEQFCERAHRIIETTGDRHLRCYTLQALAKVWIRRGATDRTKPVLLNSLRVCREHQDRLGVALMLRTIGELHLAEGDAESALHWLTQAMTIWRHLHLLLWQARTLRDIGAAHAVGSDCAQAHPHWAEAMTIFRAHRTREAEELDIWRRSWGCHCDPGVLTER
ncbi:tetratricopeptide repeat protein [Streptomyces sp. ID05-26A]|nr:tetratricopeptide repeat protein [Streptomyces sp. ID05-26A]